MRLSNENRCLVITQLLVEAGCSPRERNADNKPPIHTAVTRGFVSVVEYLLSQDVPLPSRILFAALRCTLVKRVEMTRLLVSKGANRYVLDLNGDTLLHTNMRSLDGSVCLEIAQMLIDIGCDPLVRNPRGEIPLQIAAKQGHHEVVNYLLLFSSSLDVSFLLKTEPAARVPILRSLLDHTDGLRIQLKEGDRVFQGVRPFIDDEAQCLELAKIFIGVADDHFARIPGIEMFFDIATRQGFIMVVDYLIGKPMPLPPAILSTALRHQAKTVPPLIRNGANLHVRDDNGDTLLHVTMLLPEAECHTTTRLLVEAGCDPFMPNNANKQPIHIAAARGFVSVVVYLLSHASDAKVSLPLDLSNRDYLPLLHAVLKLANIGEHEYLRTMQLLFKAGCIPFALDTDREASLHLAISRSFTFTIDYLLSQDLPLPSDILLFALQSQSMNILYRGDPYKWISMISWLVRKGADVHVRDPNKNTLLHCAMQMGTESHCLEVTKIFIEAGCSISVPNASGELPIQVAVTRGRSSAMKYLLSHSEPLPPDILLTVLPPLRRRYTPSPLVFLRMVFLLVKYGADVSAISTNGDTVLHVALAQCWPSPQALDFVEALVRAGCNTHARDAQGRTPLELAKSMEYYNIMECPQRGSFVSQLQSLLVPHDPPMQNPVSPPPVSTSLLAVIPSPWYHQASDATLL